MEAPGQLPSLPSPKSGAEFFYAYLRPICGCTNIIGNLMTLIGGS